MFFIQYMTRLNRVYMHNGTQLLKHHKGDNRVRPNAHPLRSEALVQATWALCTQRLEGAV